MNKLYVILILVGLVFNLSAGWELSGSLETTYSNNAFNLSDKDLESHEDGDEDLSFVDTSDDMMLKPSIDVKYKFELGKRKHLRLSSKLNYIAYTNNTDKSKYSSLSYVEYRNDKLTLKGIYAFYADNYSRQYKDRDGTDEYEEFAYDKDQFKLSAKYRIFKKDWVDVYGSYEMYRHNKYWVEQDGDAMEIGVGWKHSFKTFYLDGGYAYRKFDCDNGISDSSLDSYYTDTTYESNIFNVGLKNKKVRIMKKKYIRPFIKYKVEYRYYQSDNVLDDIHAGRDDVKNDFRLGSDLILSDNWMIVFTYRHQYRKVKSSVNSGLSDSKNYLTDEFSLELQYEF